MQPSNTMLRHLRVLAGLQPRPLPVEDQALRVPCDNAYSLGKIDGKAELARELLEDLARGE